MKIERRYRIEVGQPEQVAITLVGCGGTGSFLALHLARLAYHARQRHNLTLNLTFLDPDVVELKNVGRQNFCPAEVGQYKAATLARRYSTAFGAAIAYHAAAFQPEDLPNGRTLGLLIGAVDNNAARRAIHQAWRSSPRVWWLDCGNHEHAGQILLGNDRVATAPTISPLNVCTALPLPTVQHPELLNVEVALELPVPAASCADLVLQDAQSLMINQMIAAHAAEYVTRLILARNLDLMATYVDLQSGSARSVPITQTARQPTAIPQPALAAAVPVL